MSGIDMATLISIEQCPRHLCMDLNPIRFALTRFQFNVTRWTHTLNYWEVVLKIQVLISIGPEARNHTLSNTVITVLDICVCY